MPETVVIARKEQIIDVIEGGQAISSSRPADRELVAEGFHKAPESECEWHPTQCSMFSMFCGVVHCFHKACIVTFPIMIDVKGKI